MGEVIDLFSRVRLDTPSANIDIIEYSDHRLSETAIPVCTFERATFTLYRDGRILVVANTAMAIVIASRPVHEVGRSRLAWVSWADGIVDEWLRVSEQTKKERKR